MNRRPTVAIIGAGPYGLSATAHLRRAGVDVRVFGKPMSFWRSMPAGMFLRSNWGASNIAELRGELSLESFQRDTGARFTAPVPLERFIEYGEWVQGKVAPDVDRRLVSRVSRDAGAFTLTLQDGDEIAAERVVVACGVQQFAWRPPEFDDIPEPLASHTGDHADLTCFAGKRVAIVGGGQSARECAALAHEAGALVEIYARSSNLVWLRGVGVKRRLGRLGPIVYAPTDVGPLWYSRLVAVPDLFRRLPRGAQTRIARRSIRPAGSHWLIDRLRGVPLYLGTQVLSAVPVGGTLELTLNTGETRTVDHLMFGTGYRVDISRYSFLGQELLADIRQAQGYPVLSRGLESSVPGLHFLGAPAAWSFGPIMRFVSGGWYGARALSQCVTGGAPAPVSFELNGRPAPVAGTPLGAEGASSSR
jgi:FAD-dependent urate hydroxylase